MNNVNELDSQMCNESAAGFPPDLLTNHSISIKTQVRLVTLIILAVFFGEVLVMFILPFLPSIPIWGQAFVDAVLLIIFISPALYFGLFRSLNRQLEERQIISRELEKHRGHLEELVAERTTDLSVANEMLTEEVKEREATEKELWLKTHQLGERVKELNCLYGISHIVEKYGSSLGRVCQRVVDLIPVSWQYPEITCARISLFGHVYHTENFKKNYWNQTSNIIVKGESIGAVEVSYLAKRPEIDEGPFLKEERSLIDAIASRLGRIIERIDAEKELRYESNVTAVLSELYEPIIAPLASIKDIARTVLDKAKSLTKSNYGYVSSIDPDTGDNVSHTLSEMLKGQCKVTKYKGIVFPLGEDGRYGGLWGQALNSLEPFFTNSPQNHPATKGLPEGHVPIRRFLSVPVMLGEELVGQIALANKAADYTRQDLEAISRVAKFYALAIQRNRAKEALQEANEALEKRVAQRTKTLQSTNIELEKEVEDRKLAEEKLQQSKVMLQAVFEGISDPLILVDKEMRIKMMNQMAGEYYNISDHKDSIGKKCHQAAEQSQLCRDCQIPALALKGQYKSFERQSLLNPDSIEQVVVYPVKERTGDTGDAIIRISDITEAKQIERRLIQSEKMASLGVLVSSIAHEINNPNNFVSFNIPILREYTMEIIPYLDKYAAEQPDFELCNMSYAEFRQDIFKLMDNIENGAHRISSFVANLRQYSQGGSIKAFSWLDLAVLIDKVLAIIQTETNKTVKIFKKSISVNLPEIYSDGLAIEQILINLMMNAAQAVEGENSRVELNVAPRDDLLEGVVIEISDNGCGMDDDTRLKIFNPFFTTKSAGGGTGLGLYVCHNLIQGLGGQIEVESTSGKGSTFRVILPCGEAGKG
jgi:C4-dicarboxylate-specific signal transduction histidine kinase